MTWPKHFPPGCPPAVAEDANGSVYRLTSGEEPREGDFISWKQRDPERDFGDRECRACGLSVYMDLGDAQRLRSRIPAMKRKRIAIGELEPVAGKILPTPSAGGGSHHTWWVPSAVQPWTLFQSVQNLDD